MVADGRKITVDFDTDEVRWCLVDVDVVECRKCGYRLAVSFDPPHPEFYPLLLCGKCWERARRRVVMTPPIPPADDQGEPE